MMKVRFLNQQLEVGGRYLTTYLRESNDALDDAPTLCERMAEDGYLLIRGLHDRDGVMAARRRILEDLHRRGFLKPGSPLMDGIVNPDSDHAAIQTAMAHRHLVRLPELLGVVEGHPVMAFFARFLGGEVRTFDFKWLRTMCPGPGSALHYDTVFMNRGTANLFTCWSPLGDLTLEMGTLAICLGSHRFEKIKRTYGRSDVDRDLIEGDFSRDPMEMVDRFGGRWATTEFRAGDAVVFSMHTMHGSTDNASDRIRLSSDTRYQLAFDPVDERWIGAEPQGHDAYKDPRSRIEPLEVSRTRWGV